LTKLPVELSGGRRANRAPVAPEIDSTLPRKTTPGKLSASNSTSWPGFMWVSWVSLKFATTQTSDSDEIERSVWPDWMNWPGSTFFLETRPSIGAFTSQ